MLIFTVYAPIMSLAIVLYWRNLPTVAATRARQLLGKFPIIGSVGGLKGVKVDAAQ